MREELLEREPPLRRMAPIEKQIDRRVGGRTMDVLQGLPQSRQLRALEERGGQPVRQILGGRLLERGPDELAEPALSEALGRGIDRGQVLIGARRGRSVGAPVLGVHHLEARRSAAHFAETADAHAAREAFALPCREMKESQREKARAVGDSRQHLAPAAKSDFREQHFALDDGARALGDLSQRNHAGPVLVAQRQQEQEVLRGLDAERAQPLRLPLADAAQRRDGLGVDHTYGRARPPRPPGAHAARTPAAHKATMHSTSTCAPRGSEATPTAARAG